ncbi:MAG: hypothetical protein J0L94_08370 [Rhodothermia bacterium]|nr:hypothetical protein [Rhodothermia bacterium]
MAEELSIPEQLKALIRLQYIDGRIDQMHKLRGDLPDEIRDLEDERVGLQRRIDKYQQEKQDGELERKRIQFDQLESQSLIERYQKQQNQVRNNREYDALTKEIEVHRQRIQESNFRMETLKQRDEANAIALEHVLGRMEQLDNMVDGKKDELNAVMEDTRHEEDALLERRASLESAIDARYRMAYNRLRSRLRDGRAVIAIERGAAAGYAVPTQRQVEIRQRNKVIVCEHSGRIIVDQDLFRETVEEMGTAE